MEFACAAPLLTLMLLGFADAVQVGRSWLRTQSATTQIGQIVSQCRKVTAGDEKALMDLAAAILDGMSTAGSWNLVVNAIGRDSQDKPFNWSISQGPLVGPSANSKGSVTPPGLNLARDQVVWRTEVFATVKTRFLSRTIDASGSAIHMTRAPGADGLKAKGQGVAECMKEVN